MFSVNQKKRENLGGKSEKCFSRSLEGFFLASAKERKRRRKHFWQSFFFHFPHCALQLGCYTPSCFPITSLTRISNCSLARAWRICVCFQPETCTATFQHPCGKTSGRVCIKSPDDSFYKSVTAAPALLLLPRPPHRGARGESLHHTFGCPQVPSLFKK